MGFRPVTKTQDGQEVLVGFVPEEAIDVAGANLCMFVVESQACPEPGDDVRAFINENAFRNLNLFKVVDGVIVCRTPEELAASEWLTWDFNYQVPSTGL